MIAVQAGGLDSATQNDSANFSTAAGLLGYLRSLSFRVRVRQTILPEDPMITSEENELLCRVEGDAPMGQLMRRHWIPACMSEEVAEPDGTPVAVRLLGEDLVVFRDT